MPRKKGSRNKPKVTEPPKKKYAKKGRKRIAKDNDEFINIVLQAIDSLSVYGKRRILSHMFTNHIDLVEIKKHK
jgi:hypothetical protein